MIEKLIKEARKYLGVPWQHQGRSMKGIDCVGIPILAFKAIGIHVDEIQGYARTPDGTELKRVMDNQPNLVSIKEPYKKGDIILMRIRKEPQHVAILTDSNTAPLGMIHSYNGGEKKVIEHDFVDYWKSKVIAAYRIK